jgi:acylphosphatase
VEGEAEIIGQLIEQVRKGPPMSRVERVDVAEMAPTGRYRSFGIEGW